MKLVGRMVPVYVFAIVIGSGIVLCGIIVVAIVPEATYSDRAAALQTLMTALQMFGLVTLANEIRRQLAPRTLQFRVGFVSQNDVVFEALSKGALPTNLRLPALDKFFVIVVQNDTPIRLKNIVVFIEFPALGLNSGKYIVNENNTVRMDLSFYGHTCMIRIPTLSSNSPLIIPVTLKRSTEITELKTHEFQLEIEADNLVQASKHVLRVEVEPDTTQPFNDYRAGVRARSASSSRISSQGKSSSSSPRTNIPEPLA